jgi:hypothetical protein
MAPVDWMGAQPSHWECTMDTRYRIVLDKLNHEYEAQPFWTLHEFWSLDEAQEEFSAMQGPGYTDVDWSMVSQVRLLKYIGIHPFLIGKFTVSH